MAEGGAWPGLATLALEPPPAAWSADALMACEGRRRFEAHGEPEGAQDWFAAYQRAEVETPSGPHPMSPLTRDLLASAFDYRAIAEQRRKNYQVLLGLLGELALLAGLPDGVVPLGFPIRVAERHRLRQRLFNERIFPPVHWPLPEAVAAAFPASQELSAHILTLPCDQRYDAADMERMAALVLADDALGPTVPSAPPSPERLSP
jgi:hypothetical protein